MGSKKGKILLVDDEPLNLNLLQQVLSSKYETAFTSKSTKTLEIVEKIKPDLILLDVMMPEMNGYEILKKLKRKKSTRGIPVIFLTSLNMAGDEIQGIKAGAVDYIAKPVNEDLVLARVQTHISLKQEQDKNKILLERTLTGIISLLTDFLSMTNPGLLRRANQFGRYAESIAIFLNLKDTWKFKLAAILSQIGNLMLPEELIVKLVNLSTLTYDEQNLYNSHLSKSADLLSHIPNFKEISQIIDHLSNTENTLLSLDDFQQVDVEISGRKILKIIREYDRLLLNNKMRAEAIEEIKSRTEEFETFLISAMEKVIRHVKAAVDIKRLEIRSLQPGMVIHQDLSSKSNVLLMKKGMEISPTLLEKLKYFDEQDQLPQKVEVIVNQ